VLCADTIRQRSWARGTDSVDLAKQLHRPRRARFTGHDRDIDGSVAQSSDEIFEPDIRLVKRVVKIL
jgi:hypothetical protein